MTPVERRCGTCSLCCTLLRVDELGKLGGSACRHQRVGHPDGACGIHATRPRICRSYRCLWLEGKLDEGDRPDRLGAVLSLTTLGAVPTLFVHEARPGAYAASPRLQSIAERFRAALPVHISDAHDVLDADRLTRVLLPGGVEHHLRGDRIVVHRPGTPPETQRLPLLARGLRHLALGLRRLRLHHLLKRRR